MKTETLNSQMDIDARLYEKGNIKDEIAKRTLECLGRQLADKICDGKIYAVRLNDPETTFDKRQMMYSVRRNISVKEFIQCQDCGYSAVEGKTTHYLWCKRMGEPTDPHDYCSHATRKCETCSWWSFGMKYCARMLDDKDCEFRPRVDCAWRNGCEPKE